jgi:hypothetical protein
MQPADFDDVFASDRRVFGADRSALLASFYRRAPELAWTVRRGDAIAGHCFGRPGFRYKQIGPVVAEDEAVARDLVAGCLAGQLGQQVAIDVPRRAEEWMAWLESVGFTIERPFVRMRRGENDCPGIVGREFAIAGPEFG